MRRRELNYAEIALLELLRGAWESTVEGGWTALVSAAANAIRDLKIRLDALEAALAGERSPAARANFRRLTSELPARECTRHMAAAA